MYQVDLNLLVGVMTFTFSPLHCFYVTIVESGAADRRRRPILVYNNDLRTNRLEMGTTEEQQTASDYFDQKTKLARLAGGRREHCRGRPQQSRGRRARRGKTSKQHTEWWASSQATQLAYVTFYRIPIKLPASQRSALTGR